MIEHYYKEELAHLRELVAEFAASHPALASMLGGAPSDPDVERLLQGVAFKTGLLRLKLEDDFPEFIQELARLVCPQYLRPLPAATVVAFSPKPSLARTETIPAGAQLASVPVEGTRCLFRTCTEVELHPLELTDALLVQRPGEGAAIKLCFALNGISVSDWSPRALRLFLPGEYSSAAELYLLLRRHLKSITITPEEGGRPVILPVECLLSTAFSDEESVIPYPSDAHPGFRLIQEYFTIPQRFLFLDLVGWERWIERGNGRRFSLNFELDRCPPFPPRVKLESFALFATPAVNTFHQDAKPVLLDNRRRRYPLRPDGLPPEHAQVLSVDRVSGYMQGSGKQRSYFPFQLFRRVTSIEPAFHTTVVTSPVSGEYDVQLLVHFPKGEPLPDGETLSIRLTCTNGTLPGRLRIRDLCVPTGSSPECATFGNVTPVSSPVTPRLGKFVLWHLVSHLSLNLSSFSRAENLRELLGLYLFEEWNSDQAGMAANRRRIDGIEELLVRPADRLVRGVPIRGSEIVVRIKGDHFAGAGDLFLFGCILDEFFAGYAPINSFTRLIFQETSKGEIIQWPQRLGQQPLL